jgi:hypothetical protein
MKVSKSHKTAVTFTESLYSNCYITSWGNQSVELTFMDETTDGTEHKFEFSMPLAKARLLAKELVEDIANFDEEQAKRLAEAEASEE